MVVGLEGMSAALPQEEEMMVVTMPLTPRMPRRKLSLVQPMVLIQKILVLMFH